MHPHDSAALFDARLQAAATPAWVRTLGGLGFKDPAGVAQGLAGDLASAERVVQAVNAHELLMDTLMALRVAAQRQVALGDAAPSAAEFGDWLCREVDDTLAVMVARGRTAASSSVQRAAPTRPAELVD